MPANIVVGSQWGDEGKGKIIDIMASRADVVVRATGRQQCRSYRCQQR